MQQSINYRGALLVPAGALVINAFVWGVSWWPFRELQGQGLHPLWSTTLVYLLICSALLVGSLVPLLLRRRKRECVQIRPPNIRRQFG